jgi:hypothetical protein
MYGDDFASVLGGILEVAMWLYILYYLVFDLVWVLVSNYVVLVLIISKVVIHGACILV